MFNNIILSVMAWTTNTVESLVTRLKEERGQDIIEYAIIVGAIAIAAGFALFAFGFDFGNFAAKIQDCIDFNQNGNCG